MCSNKGERLTLDPSPNLEIRSPLYDLTPPANITAVVTEIGIIPPNSISSVPLTLGRQTTWALYMYAIELICNVIVSLAHENHHTRLVSLPIWLQFRGAQAAFLNHSWRWNLTYYYLSWYITSNLSVSVPRCLVDVGVVCVYFLSYRQYNIISFLCCSV